MLESLFWFATGALFGVLCGYFRLFGIFRRYIRHENVNVENVEEELSRILKKYERIEWQK